MRKRSPLLLFVLLLVTPSIPLLGQGFAAPGGEGQEEVVDRVAAIVGDSVILYSEVLEQLQRERAVIESQGGTFPTDPEELRAFELETLDEIINQQLLVQAAAQDTLIVVSEEQVERAFAQEWAGLVRQFQGEENLMEEVARQGQSMSGFRASRRNEIRQQLLIQQFVTARQRDARTIAVDESEVEAFYERERATLQQRPATIAFRQAIIQPRPSDSDMEVAKAEAERILGLLEQGDSFSELARRFSDDPGSRQEGGDLGWFRRGSDLDQDFEDAAFRLREGEVSRPVETVFGAHIIRVERVRGPERRIHHILVGADGDSDAARERAQEIREAVEGGASMREFSRQYATEQLPDSVEIAMDQLSEFPTAYAEALRSGEPGSLQGPIELPLDEAGTRVVWAVLQILDVREPGEFTLDDLRPQIREHLRRQKFEARMMEGLRARTYLEIRI